MKTSKVKLKYKVDIDDLLTLIYWVKVSYSIENKIFNYQNLLSQVETYKFTQTPFDTRIHSIDDLMIDAFKVYHKLKMTEQERLKVIESINVPLINKNDLISETKHYERIFEDLIENYKFEDPEIRGIQKGILTEKLKECVYIEDYENAAKLRDMINEC